MRTEHAVWGLIVQSPIDITLRLRLEPQIVEEIGEWHQAIEKVWAALPGFSSTAEPSAVGADIGPSFVQVTTQAVGLNLQLGTQPSRGANCAQPKRIERTLRERCAISYSGLGRRRRGSAGDRREKTGGKR